ncbi:hypothetical protein [uncultured Mediterranean phage uvMED]|nr:hypothetical protein [uncultured Mediterranean phage uvMED]
MPNEETPTHECCNCDSEFTADDMNTSDITGENYCVDCFWEVHTTCDDCDETCLSEDINYCEANERQFCDSCEDYYNWRECCGEWFPEDYDNNGSPCNCNHDRIHSYDYRPNLRVYDYNINRDNGSHHRGYSYVFRKEITMGSSKLFKNYNPRRPLTKCVMGFELEVEQKTGDGKLVGDMAEDVTMYSKDVKTKEPFLYCMQDGSLSNGFEIASLPFTESYYKNIIYRKRMMKNVLSILRGEGYRSYNTRNCGMHIHVNRNSFTGDVHLYKFHLMFYKNEEFIGWFSNRNPENLERWSNVYGVSKDRIRNRIKRKSSPKFYAVHITPKNTVEIRIFRGTLDFKAFCKNIEFVFALKEFSSRYSIRNMKAGRFIRWLKTIKRYPNLTYFFENLKPRDGFDYWNGVRSWEDLKPYNKNDIKEYKIPTVYEEINRM